MSLIYTSKSASKLKFQILQMEFHFIEMFRFDQTGIMFENGMAFKCLVHRYKVLYSKQTIAATFPIQNVLFNINGGILMLTIIPFVTLKTENGSKKKWIVIFILQKKTLCIIYISFFCDGSFASLWQRMYNFLQHSQQFLYRLFYYWFFRADMKTKNIQSLVFVGTLGNRLNQQFFFLSNFCLLANDSSQKEIWRKTVWHDKSKTFREWDIYSIIQSIINDATSHFISRR